MQRFLVCGSRDWTDEAAIRRELEKMPRTALLIHGGCRGADQIAMCLWVLMGGNERTFKADWKTHAPGCHCAPEAKTCKAQGPIRNQRMIDEGRPEYALAFHADIESSRGTKDMVERLKAAGIHGRIVRR